MKKWFAKNAKKLGEKKYFLNQKLCVVVVVSDWMIARNAFCLVAHNALQAFIGSVVHSIANNRNSCIFVHKLETDLNRFWRRITKAPNFQFTMLTFCVLVAAVFSCPHSFYSRSKAHRSYFHAALTFIRSRMNASSKKETWILNLLVLFSCERRRLRVKREWTVQPGG